jgi:hypothetical protein
VLTRFAAAAAAVAFTCGVVELVLSASNLNVACHR